MHSPTLPTLPQGLQPAPGLWVSGQPDAAQFAALKTAGFGRVINLRPLAETPDFDEAALLAALGLDYRHLPVSGPGDLDRARVAALDGLLAEPTDGPVLVHCATGNRVGALMALRAAWLGQQSEEQALAVGRAHGLTRMEPAVAAILAGG